MPNYFNIQGYASNSGLNEFGKELGLLNNFDTTDEQKEENFRIGTLFDILETEPHRINILENKIIGTDYYFTSEELKFWKEKQKMLMNEKFYKQIIDLKPSFQTEFYQDDFYLEEYFKVKFKGKLDLYLNGMVIDLKTTKCKTQKEFENTCQMFGYYRQMIFYMTGMKCENSLLIGISKTTNKVFKVFFNERHELYQENLEMCKLLLQKWALLK